MFLQILPIYLISIALAAGVIVLAFAIITHREGPMLVGPGGPSTPPLAGAPAPGAPPVVAPMPDPVSGQKLLLEQAANGLLDQQTMELWRQLPEFDRCQECFRKCEDGFGGGIAFVMRDCRLECLKNCSENARSLMNK
jgi:hypothetical protein